VAVPLPFSESELRLLGALLKHKVRPEKIAVDNYRMFAID
jgi:hypothetical protein